MQKGRHLQFQCTQCQEPVNFSLFEIENHQQPISCTNCHKRYAFTDENLLRQISKFEALCQQIADSEEILGNTAVGIDIEGHHVTIPYKLLLTRMTSQLKLHVGDQEIAITFRMEPLKDLPERT